MMTVTLETERLHLRPFRHADYAPYAAFLADEESTRYLGGTRDGEAVWRIMATFCGHWHLRGYGPFAVEEKATGNFIGYCGPWFPCGRPEREFVWGILPNAQRKGYATEAAQTARRWAYEVCGWSVAVSNVMPENTVSSRVAEKLGAQKDGTVVVTGILLDVWRHPPATEVLQ